MTLPAKSEWTQDTVSSTFEQLLQKRVQDQAAEEAAKFVAAAHEEARAHFARQSPPPPAPVPAVPPVLVQQEPDGQRAATSESEPEESDTDKEDKPRSRSPKPKRRKPATVAREQRTSVQ